MEGRPAVILFSELGAPADEKVWLLASDPPAPANRLTQEFMRKAEAELQVKFVRVQDVNFLGQVAYGRSIPLLVDGVRHELPVILVSEEFVRTGRVTDNELHEIGHRITDWNVIQGIADPMAIRFVGIGKEPGRVERYWDIHYGSRFSADESRQYAQTLHHLVHGRPDSEVSALLQNGRALRAWEVYGVNRDGFFGAMEELRTVSQMMVEFSERGRRLATEGLETLKIPGVQDRLTRKSNKNFVEEIILSTSASEIHVPWIDNGFSKFSKEEYLAEYLLNYRNAIDRQMPGMDFVRERLAELRSDPNQWITLEDYRTLRDATARLISTVGAQQEHLGKFADLVPARKIRDPLRPFTPWPGTD